MCLLYDRLVLKYSAVAVYSLQDYTSLNANAT